jgi:hypothetical protein
MMLGASRCTRGLPITPTTLIISIIFVIVISLMILRDVDQCLEDDRRAAWSVCTVLARDVH